MNPINVILAGPLPAPIAGPELVTQTLLREAPAADIRYVFVDLTARNNPSRGRWNPAGIFRALGQGCRLTWMGWRWRKRAKIVHLPLSQSNTGVLRDLLLLGVARILGYRVLVQFHGGDFYQFWSRCPYRKLVSRALGTVDRLLVFDAKIKTQFPFVPPYRITVLPNPIPTEWTREFSNIPRRNTERDPLRILFVSHISVAKGFLDLIQALSLLPKSQAWELHVAGERIDIERNILWTGSNMNQAWARALEILDAAGIRERVTFYGVLGGEAKERLFRRGHVLVLPSYSEGLPVVILEAMYAGLAVIATDVGAIPGLIDKAVVIKPGDVSALTAILSHLNPEGAIRCGYENRKRVEPRYLPSQVLAALRTIYEELEGTHPPMELAKPKAFLNTSQKTRGRT